MAGYLFLTGNSLPTRRAFYMTAAASLLYSSSRRTPPLWLLATAALVILLNEPLAFFQPSFQLSFAGLFGILFWLPAWQKPFIDKPLYLRWPVMLFLTTLAATLATAPLTLWHFHIFAPAGLLTNLAATPLLAWGAVPVGLMGVVLSPIFPQAADLCFEGSGALVAVTFRMVETMAALPGLTARYHFASLSDIVAMVLLLVSVSIPCRSWSGKLLCGVLLTGGLAISLGLPEESPSLQVVALSVGQGDATLLSFSAGQHYLIDGGGLPGSGFDPGERLVAPALGRLNVKRLQGVILTHDHPDHRDGLKYILEHFAVDAFFSGQAFADLDPALRETLMRRNIPVKTLKAQWTTLSSEEDLQLQIFTPRQNHPDINECSLVIYAGLGEDGVLLTGDMGAEGLEQLLAAGLPGPANLLKLPHHGSRGSDPARYLHDIAPQIAFVSAGRNNPYNLPHPQTLENCRDRHIPVFRTDTDGTLGFRSTGAGWTTPQRPEGFSVDEN
jgi:competence protein ComEC